MVLVRQGNQIEGIQRNSIGFRKEEKKEEQEQEKLYKKEFFMPRDHRLVLLDDVSSNDDDHDLEFGHAHPIHYSSSSSSCCGACFTPACSAYTAVILFVLVALIQLAIAAGLLPSHNSFWKALWQEQQYFHFILVPLIWLSSWWRLARILSALVWLGFAWIVWHRFTNPFQSCQNWPCFLLTAYMTLNTVGNCLATDIIQRNVYGPVSVVLAICCFRVSTTIATSEAPYPDHFISIVRTSSMRSEESVTLLDGNAFYTPRQNYSATS